MKKILFLLTVVLLPFACTTAQKTASTKTQTATTPEPVRASLPPLGSLMDSVSYALGVSIFENFKRQHLDQINIDLLAKAMKDVKAGRKPLISAQDANPVIMKYQKQVRNKALNAEKAKGEAFLKANAKRKGIHITKSGLQYEIIKEGTGKKPKATDKVTVHYTGTLIDGTKFDSSYDRGQPATFPLNGVIAGWTEGLQLMKEGAKYKFYIPSGLAYGDRGAGGQIPPGATLIFEVELIKVEAPDENK